MASSFLAVGSKAPFEFTKLPSELQLRVFDYLSFDEISQYRSVCKSFNEVFQQLLNAGFHRIERFHARSLQRVKSQLPRRESERRTHGLARHTDILTSMETRLSLLSMTYGKYIDSTLCCFIPGKVLDEMFRVLRIVNHIPRGDEALRPHELLQELRDISSMAMEHFEEHIVPLLRDRINMSPSASNRAAAASLSTSALVLYAAASASPPSLSISGLSTVSKNGAGCSFHQGLHFADICRRQRPQIAAGYSLVNPVSIDSQQVQNQRFETLKRQHQLQRGELNVYKRELSKVRSTVQRQKEKLNEMERRLNEHEQRFADLFAQLRNSGLTMTSAPGNNGPMINVKQLDSGYGSGSRFGKRKRTNEHKEESSAAEPKPDTKATLKRRKMAD